MSKTYSFLLLPGFTLLSYVAATEVLRHANRAYGQTLVDWEALSLDGAPVQASNGMTVAVDGAIRDAGALKWLCVCSGFQPTAAVSRQLTAFLVQQDRFGATVGGTCSGAYILARAGLLKGACTIHWEHLDSLQEEFPGLDANIDLFTITGRRFTCAGGAAMFDLILDYMHRDFGAEVVEDIRCQLMVNRSQEDRQYYQRSALMSRSSCYHPGLVRAIGLMEKNIEEPLARESLAAGCGLSLRHMERLFRRAFKAGPAEYYLNLRLKKARYLLCHTSMRIVDIAFACGFTSSSHFSKTFRERYGAAPMTARSQYYFSGDPRHVTAA